MTFKTNHIVCYDISIYGTSINTLYVAKSSTVSLQNGTGLAPFTSIQSALNYATANTTILVSPGIYSENIVIPDLDGLAIIGSSEMNTFIINNGNLDTITWVPGAVSGALVNRFALKCFTIQNTSASNKCINIDAAAVNYPDTFCSDEFNITEVDFDGVQGAGVANMYFRNTGVVYWNHGDCIGGDLFIDTCATFRTLNIQVGSLAAPMNIKATYEGSTDIHNGLGRTDYTFSTSTAIYGNLNIWGHPVIQLDITSLIVGNVAATNLTSYYASGRDYCPLFSLYGQIGIAGGGLGNITITFPDPSILVGSTSINAVDLSNSHIMGVVNLTKTNFVPATARGYAVVLGQAQFDKGTASSITVNGYISMDMRGATYSQSALTTSTPSVTFVDRNTIIFIGAAVGAKTIVPMLPAGTTYSATATPGSAVTVYITSKTNAGFTLTGGTADVTLTRI